MDTKLKKKLYRILVALLIFIIALVMPFDEKLKIVLYIVSYLVVGIHIVWKVIRNIRNFDVLDEHFLTTIATFGAIYLGDYTEAVAIMLFFSIGEFFEDYAVNKSRKSIAELMNIRPDYANILKDGNVIKVDPNDVAIDDIIVVRSGEKIPLDGVVIEGTSTLNTAAITGESIPSNVEAGDRVVSGCINITGLLQIKVLKAFADSTVSKILDLVENASTKKANIEHFITKFARYYTPIVVGLAALIAIVPPLFSIGGGFNDWFYRAITFIVISCPCALVISVPLSFFGGLGAASRNGILIKGSNYLEALANAKNIVFDKTGTITKGNFAVVNINPKGISEEELLHITALVECNSNHPIAKSIVNANKRKLNKDDLKDVKEYPGYGIEACLRGENDRKIYVGNKKLMDRFNIVVDDVNDLGSVLYVIVDNNYVGHITIADEIKDDSKKAIKMLNDMGIDNIAMLTGDRKEIAEAIAQKVEIKNVYSELLPTDKVEKLEDILDKKFKDDRLIFVGDGVNDAPVLARADIGVAMGGIGSDAAIEAADVVIMTDELSKLAVAIKISKKTIKIAKENIIFAIGVKIIVLLLGLFGFAAIWAAIFADVGVSVIAIVNSLRTLNFKDNQQSYEK